MNTKTKIISVIITIFILLGFALPLNPPAGFWYQQFMPNLHGARIYDITFTDSLTGYAAANYDSSNISYLLKTTNGGDNWLIKISDNASFTKLAFLNSNTGFVGRGAIVSSTQIIKTTNGGNVWTTINLPEDGFVNDMSVLSEDTIWVADPIGLVGGLYWTGNGGANWQRIYGGTGNNPEKIYMINTRVGFMSRGGSPLNKTYDGGYNWAILTGGPWTDIYFIDSLRGWKANGDMKKTTDGGLNWVTQTLPYGGMIEGNAILSFSNLNKDTIWASVGGIRYPNNRLKYYLLRTTNGGDTWYFQIPDTTFGLFYKYVNFVNKFKGWATDLYPAEIHTTTGGDTTFYLGVQQVSNKIPKDYELYQNYPNPFNPRTVIPYKLKASAYVRLIAYDILGKEIQIMVDQKQNAGEYEVDFIGKFSASGVYFYRMEVISERSKRVFSETKKMILIK